MKTWLSSIVHYLLIGNCDFCHRELKGKDFNRICLRCASQLNNTQGKELCSQCSQPLDSLLYHKDSQGNDPEKGKKPVCYECSHKVTSLKENRSLFLNQRIAQQLVYDFKFKPHSSYTSVIVFWALKKQKEYLNSFDVFVPIPLGKKGLYEREFCQVSKVTYSLARKLGKSVANPIIRNEKKYKKSQHQLTAKERKRAIGEKYQYAKRFQNYFNNTKILLVDDIYTTGSTLKNAAEMLASNNSNSQVSSFTFLRTTLPPPNSSPGEIQGFKQLSKV